MLYHIENCERKAIEDAGGNPRKFVYFSKAKKGEPSMRHRKPQPTYS